MIVLMSLFHPFSIAIRPPFSIFWPTPLVEFSSYLWIFLHPDRWQDPPVTATMHAWGDAMDRVQQLLGQRRNQNTLENVNAAKETIFLSRSLTPIGCNTPTVHLFADNQAAIRLASNPVHHPRIKWINIPYDKVQISYIPTADMGADELTKPPNNVKLAMFVEILGFSAPPTS